MGRSVRLLACLASFCAVSGTMGAQAAGDSAGRGRVSGVVFDSIAGVPLAGAEVQLVRDDSTMRSWAMTTDSLGRFVFTALTAGRYLLGFFHPMLDSLGIEAPVRQAVVRDDTPVRLDLAIPSPTRIRTTICGQPAAADSGAIVLGFVRHARDASPAPHVRVTGEWYEISFTQSGITRSSPRLVSVSLDNGWFAMCGVPRGGIMGLTASRGEDSSGVVEIQIPTSGFARRDLYIAAVPAVSAPDSAERRAARTVRRGDIRLHGTVRRTQTGEPISGAQVVLSEGPYATTDERGQWSLGDAPAGTRMLEVRAVGFYPERIPVNVVAGAPPIHVSLNTLRAVLDTINVRARRVRLEDVQGFEHRRRTAMGRFLGPRDIALYPGRELSHILAIQPGVQVHRNPDGTTAVYMRGGRDTSNCEAELYIDGKYMFTTSDIDMWVRPERVIGIEIYNATTAPPQFQRPVSADAMGIAAGCGAIVIWTR